MMPVCPPPSTTAIDPMLPVDQVSIVILYDPANGDIVYGHQDTTIVGATPPTAAQLESAAKRIFARAQPAANQNVAALILSGAAHSFMCPGTTYKVVNCALVPG